MREVKRDKPILLCTVTNYKEEKHEESSVVSVRRRIIKKKLIISRGGQRNFGGIFRVLFVISFLCFCLSYFTNLSRCFRSVIKDKVKGAGITRWP